nr:hypothetical protein [Bradyrhizobium japonicum]
MISASRSGSCGAKCVPPSATSNASQPHCIFKQATQDKVRPEGDGLADPDGFTCLCASFFIWASGFTRDGDVIGVHMLTFANDGASRMSARELQRQTDMDLRKFDGFLARMGMPSPIRAQTWATPPEEMFGLTPAEIATMTRETAFARMREANCRSGAARWRAGSRSPLPTMPHDRHAISQR